jgi:hypothetical protein
MKLRFAFEIRILATGGSIGLLIVVLASCSAKAAVNQSAGGLGSGSGGAGPTGCRQASDCRGFQPQCSADPCLAFFCMGQPQPCTSDADCAEFGAGFRCDACPGGTFVGLCIEHVGGCHSGECGAATTCDATQQHCVLLPCQTASQCPPNFTCASGTGTCTRKKCATDADCDDYCVWGWCADTLGACVDSCT